MELKLKLEIGLYRGIVSNGLLRLLLVFRLMSCYQMCVNLSLSLLVGGATYSETHLDIAPEPPPQIVCAACRMPQRQQQQFVACIIDDDSARTYTLGMCWNERSLWLEMEAGALYTCIILNCFWATFRLLLGRFSILFLL